MLSKVNIVLRLHVEGVDEVKKAIEVDNVDIPREITKLKVYVEKGSLVIDIEATDVGTLRNTVNDILRCIVATQRILKTEGAEEKKD